MSVSLEGLEVLATRPVQQSEEWQQALEGVGAKVCSVPLLAITALEAEAHQQTIKNCILSLDEYASVIFVSQNAVHFAVDWIDRYWPQLPVGINWLAIGSKTAADLQMAGYEVQAASSGMNSEELLALPCLQNPTDKKILICRGLGGRTRLADSLRARGAQVDYCELYERSLPEQAQGQLQSLDWGADKPTVLSVFSGETLNNLLVTCERLARPCLQLPILVPGQRVAAAAKEAGFATIIESENASVASMLQALLDWHQRTAS